MDGYQVFAHRTPEETGVDSRDILSLLNNIEQSIHCPDALMVVKDGAIIAQGYWAPFEENDKHILQSASKSFTGLAVGLLVKDGKLSLDERLADIFPEYVSEFTSERAQAHHCARFAHHVGLQRQNARYFYQFKNLLDTKLSFLFARA